MALPAILRRLFKSSGYGPELNDDLISRNIFIRQWVNTYNYEAGVLARGSDGLIYMSVTASGPGTSAGARNPVSAGPSYWIAPKVPTAAAGTNSNVVASTAFVKAAVDAGVASAASAAAPLAVPVGCIMYYGSTSAPSKWRICNGGAISRTTYADLFAVIGTRFGAGDGSTTFNVPNLIDRFPQGNATPGTVKAAGLPNITGNTMFYSNNNEGSGHWYGNSWKTSTQNAKAGNLADAGWGTAVKFNKLEMDASHASSIYGNSATVQPPALTLLPIIKIQKG